jgi:hypothetical protein
MFKTNPKLEELLLSALCLLVALGALAVVVWTLATGQVGEQGLDALFSISICLLIVVTFGAIPLQAWRKKVWKEAVKQGSPTSGKAAVATGRSTNAEGSA